jgi:hypothetical protein
MIIQLHIADQTRMQLASSYALPGFASGALEAEQLIQTGIVHTTLYWSCLLMTGPTLSWSYTVWTDIQESKPSFPSRKKVSPKNNSNKLSYAFQSCPCLLGVLLLQLITYTSQ